MGILHTVNKSPFAHTTLLSCLEICDNTDGILLIEDGVIGALTSSPCTAKLTSLIDQGLNVYALASDLKARGLLTSLHPTIQLTDYDGFVELSIKYRCVQSWY